MGEQHSSSTGINIPFLESNPLLSRNKPVVASNIDIIFSCYKISINLLLHSRHKRKVSEIGWSRDWVLEVIADEVVVNLRRTLLPNNTFAFISESLYANRRERRWDDNYEGDNIVPYDGISELLSDLSPLIHNMGLQTTARCIDLQVPLACAREAISVRSSNRDLVL